MDKTLKRLLLLALLSGGAYGIYMLTRSSRQKLTAQIISLITDEAFRLGKSIDPDHLSASLRRFDEGQLELFHRYVKAYVARDSASLLNLLPEWKARMLPLMQNAPEWKRYGGIIFGT